MDAETYSSLTNSEQLRIHMLLPPLVFNARSALIAVLAAVLLAQAACGGQSSNDAELEALRVPAVADAPPAPISPAATAVPAPEFIIRSLSVGLHVCALRDTGLAECWGRTGYGDHGQLDPPSNERFVSIAAGRTRSCGLREDGTVVCWGSNEEGQSSPPRNERFISITAGAWDHYCGLREDGTAVCWGSNGAGKSSPPGGAFVSIAAGEHTTCGLRPDGRAICWGDGVPDFREHSSRSVSDVILGAQHLSVVCVQAAA